MLVHIHSMFAIIFLLVLGAIYVYPDFASRRSCFYMLIHIIMEPTLCKVMIK